jgi:2-oxoglutarate ferredoxin oxidoreductase subunit beta
MAEEGLIETQVYSRPTCLKPIGTHFCPGCTHGIAVRVVAEVIEEMGVRGNTIGVAAVGCGGILYEYLNLDIAQASHGRAPAMATGLKRACPDNIVFTYQGDGDLAAIGTAEILHAAARGENITVIFINNAVFGMTGGQMAPTTLPNQQTTSSQKGRDVEVQGYPMRVCEVLAQLDGASYVVRRSLHNYPNVRKAKKAIRQAFEVQRMKQGFSLVELLSTCPTSWNMSAAEALHWIEEKMLPVYPLGDFKVTTK